MLLVKSITAPCKSAKQAKSELINAAVCLKQSDKTKSFNKPYCKYLPIHIKQKHHYSIGNSASEAMTLRHYTKLYIITIIYFYYYYHCYY